MGDRSGKSKSRENPKGIRRKEAGKELAPRSLRKKKKFLSEWSDEALERVGVL